MSVELENISSKNDRCQQHRKFKIKKDYPAKRKFGQGLEAVYETIGFDLPKLLVETNENEIPRMDIDVVSLSTSTSTSTGLESSIPGPLKKDIPVVCKEDMIKILQTLDFSKKVVKKFRCIYADVPWAFKNKNTGGSMSSGAANKYETMTMDRVLVLGDIIRDITDDDGSLLFMWVPTALQKEAMEVMKNWGFTYKTKMYWYKKSPNGSNKMGMGFWFRNAVEELWVGTRGDVKAFNLQIPNIMEKDRMNHSFKPECFREIIDECVRASFRDIEDKETISKMELFYTKDEDSHVSQCELREKQWTVHGYDVDNNQDIANVLIDRYYPADLHDIMSVRSGFRYRVDRYDVAKLAKLFREEKNKRMVLTKIYYNKKIQEQGSCS